MALTNAERQRRYWLKAKQAVLARIDARLPSEIAIKLSYLAHHWNCTKTEALQRVLMDTSEREGNPIPGYNPEEDVQLPGNGPVSFSFPDMRCSGRIQTETYGSKLWVAPQAGNFA